MKKEKPYWKQRVKSENEFRIWAKTYMSDKKKEPLANAYKDGDEYIVDKETWVMESAGGEINGNETNGENWLRMWEIVANFESYEEAEAFIKKEHKKGA